VAEIVFLLCVVLSEATEKEAVRPVHTLL